MKRITTPVKQARERHLLTHKGHIRNRDLLLSDIPKTIRNWEKFALTFPGYEIHGGFDGCAAIANQRAPKTLTDYRTCLFFEQRRRRHWDCGSGGSGLNAMDAKYIRALLAGIRMKVREKAIE